MWSRQGTTAACPPKLRSHSMSEWLANNRETKTAAEDQQRLANQIVCKSACLIDAARHTTTQWKEETDFRLDECILNVRFLLDEVHKQRKVACIEEDVLRTYQRRLRLALDNLTQNGLSICHQCIEFRSKCPGLENVNDSVNRELQLELKQLTGAQALLIRTSEQADEQLRRLRATIHSLDKDLEQNEKLLAIDEVNLRLNETQLLPITECTTSATNATHKLASHENLEVQSFKKIQDTAKELNAALSLRSYVDVLLKQCVEDVKTCSLRTNQAFTDRIRQTSHAKAAVELLHSDTMSQLNEINCNVDRLELERRETQRFIVLAQTRHTNRAQRSDSAGKALTVELQTLHATVAQLDRLIAESRASLRYLLQTKVQQEFEIDQKTVTLQIDRCDCMTLRQRLVFDMQF